jgi:uncharacterized repeat protein (TIGR03803 family)
MRIIMKRLFLVPVLRAAAALLLLGVSPIQAATYTYSLLGFTSVENSTPLIQARDGLLYGAGQSQATNAGRVYNTALSSGANTNSVYAFADSTDGGLPVGAPVQGPDGTLFGTSNLGGTSNSGVIYNLTGLSPSTGGTETALYNFASDGTNPQGAVIFDSTGNLYGTASGGGQHSAGVLFKYIPGSNTFSSLYEFGQLANCADGAAPYSGPVQGTDGNFYGATEFGGTACGNTGAGTLYQITPSGTLTSLHVFCTVAGCADGSGPNKFGPLVEFSDGNFYGLTASGGANGAGTIFRITSAGVLTTLYSFNPGNGTDGGNPLGGLIIGSDGNFYGTTQNHGANGFGTVFQFTPAGQESTLYSFDYAHSDGYPYAGLVQGSNGNFYGATSGFTGDTGGYVYELAVSPALAPPVQLSFSKSTVAVGATATLNWKVLNAFSQTLRNCYASVQGNPAGAGGWTGLKAGTYNAGTKLLSGSTAVTPTAVGTHTYALTCGGQESGFATLAASLSGKAAPTVTVSATPNPAVPGQPITITAAATGSGATPTGTVAFKYGTLTLTTLPLTSGSASFSPSTASLPSGSYVLTASYSGDGSYDPAASAGYTVTLSQRTPTVSLSATPNPAAIGQAISITATASGSGATPTGTVTIKYGTRALTTLPLTGGSASFSPSTTALPANTYGLSVSYSGDANYTAANSASYSITLTKATTAVALSATPATVVQGKPCTLMATVTRSGAAGIPTGSVTFSVGAKNLATVAVNSAGVASFTASTAGVAYGYYPVKATYAGDGADNGAISNTVTVYVRPPGYGY